MGSGLAFCDPNGYDSSIRRAARVNSAKNHSATLALACSQ